MSFFLESPFEYCDVANEHILLDQTYEQCRRSPACEQCPFRAYFTGYAFTKVLTSTAQVEREVPTEPDAEAPPDRGLHNREKRGRSR